MRPKKRPTVMLLMVLRLDLLSTPGSNNIAGVHYLKRTKNAIRKTINFITWKRQYVSAEKGTILLNARRL